MEDYVPWMRSILDRMKELYNKPNAQTIAEALPELGGGGGGSGTDSNAVHYTPDSGKTEAEKQQARDNINAAASSDIPDVSGLEPKKLVVTVTESGGVYSADKTFTEMWTAYHVDHKLVMVEMGDAEFVLSAADPFGMAFTSVSVGSGNATLSMLAVDDNDDWSYAEFAAGLSTVAISSTTPTITPAPNTVYNCGELTSLTINNPPATGKYSIVFFSGATATTTVGIENFVAEANKRYKITVEDNYATYDSWPYTPT